MRPSWLCYSYCMISPIRGNFPRLRVQVPPWTLFRIIIVHLSVKVNSTGNLSVCSTTPPQAALCMDPGLLTGPLIADLGLAAQPPAPGPASPGPLRPSAPPRRHARRRHSRLRHDRGIRHPSEASSALRGEALELFTQNVRLHPPLLPAPARIAGCRRHDPRCRAGDVAGRWSARTGTWVPVE